MDCWKSRLAAAMAHGRNVFSMRGYTERGRLCPRVRMAADWLASQCPQFADSAVRAPCAQASGHWINGLLYEARSYSVADAHVMVGLDRFNALLFNALTSLWQSIGAPLIIVAGRWIYLPAFAFGVGVEIHADVIHVTIDIADHVLRIQEAVIVRVFLRFMP